MDLCFQPGSHSVNGSRVQVLPLVQVVCHDPIMVHWLHAHDFSALCYVARLLMVLALYRPHTCAAASCCSCH